MITKTAIMGAAAFALLAAAVVGSSHAMAQNPAQCSGTVHYVNGQYVVQNEAPADEGGSQCEVLVMPSGIALQNGGSTRAYDGVDAPHSGP